MECDLLFLYPGSSLPTCQGSIYLWIVALSLKYPDEITRHVYHSDHQDFWQKNSNESEAHEVLETRYISYYDNDSADHLQLAHSLLSVGCPGSYHKLS